MGHAAQEVRLRLIRRGRPLHLRLQLPLVDLLPALALLIGAHQKQQHHHHRRRVYAEDGDDRVAASGEHIALRHEYIQAVVPIQAAHAEKRLVGVDPCHGSAAAGLVQRTDQVDLRNRLPMLRLVAGADDRLAVGDVGIDPAAHHRLIPGQQALHRRLIGRQLAGPALAGAKDDARRVLPRHRRDVIEFTVAGQALGEYFLRILPYGGDGAAGVQIAPLALAVGKLRLQLAIQHQHVGHALALCVILQIFVCPDTGQQHAGRGQLRRLLRQAHKALHLVRHDDLPVGDALALKIVHRAIHGALGVPAAEIYTHQRRGRNSHEPHRQHEQKGGLVGNSLHHGVTPPEPLPRPHRIPPEYPRWCRPSSSPPAPRPAARPDRGRPPG